MCREIFFLIVVSSACVRLAHGFTDHSQTATSQADTHADKGLELAQAGNLAAAEVELKQAVELAPNDAGFLSSLGTVLAMEKKLDESSKFFERALKIAPEDLTARRYLAANLWQLHRYPEAKRNLEILLKRKPGDPQATLLFGMVSENMHDYSAAAKALAAVPTLVQQQPESIAALAHSYYRLNETDKARTTLQDLLTNSAGAVLLGAHIADEEKDYGTAEKFLASLKPSFPDQPALSYEIARVQYHAGRFKECEQTQLDLIAAGHASARVYNLLGWCYDGLNQPKDAAQAMSEAIGLEPEIEQNYLDRGNILLAHHLLPAALDAAKQAAERFPKSAQALLLKGSIELNISQFPDAIASYSRVIELDKNSSDGRLGLAEAQSATGMADKAKASFKAGIKQFPKDARFKVQYALLLLKEAETGDSSAEAQAEELLKAAVALDPNSSEAHYQLGEMALKKGDAVDAAMHLHLAAKSNPRDSRVHFALAQTYRRLGRKEDASKEMDAYQKLKAEEEPTATPALGTVNTESQN